MSKMCVTFLYSCPALKYSIRTGGRSCLRKHDSSAQLPVPRVITSLGQNKTEQRTPICWLRAERPEGELDGSCPALLPSTSAFQLRYTGGDCGSVCESSDGNRLCVRGGTLLVKTHGSLDFGMSAPSSLMRSLMLNRLRRSTARETGHRAYIGQEVKRMFFFDANSPES